MVHRIDISGVLPPQNVELAVAVEVASSVDMPGVIDGPRRALG